MFLYLTASGLVPDTLDLLEFMIGVCGCVCERERERERVHTGVNVLEYHCWRAALCQGLNKWVDSKRGPFTLVNQCIHYTLCLCVCVRGVRGEVRAHKHLCESVCNGLCELEQPRSSILM